MDDIVYELVSQPGVVIDDEEMATIMNRLMRIKPHQGIVYTWDDIGMATLMDEIYRDSIRFCPQYKSWYLWDGSRWAKQIDSGVVSDKLQTLLNLLVIYCKEISTSTGEDMKTYQKYLGLCRKSTGLKNIMSVLETRCRISANEWDSNPYILNTPACAYDLRDMSIIEDRENLNLTQVTTCNLNTPHEKCARWYRFIDEITCGNKELASFLQRAIGYSILGVNREECMFIALGSQTRNGKGTFFSTIMNVLGGEYAQGSDPNLICESRSGKTTDFNAPQPALRKLTNCRFVAMSEAQKDVRLDAASMKAMTGRDVLTTRGLFENSFDFVPQFTLWLNTNYLPAITDDTVFKSDRIWVLKFDAFFDASKRDLDLKQTFAKPENKPTILEWIVEGCQEYMKHGLMVPECVREATEEYRDRFDRIGNFLREEVTIDPTYESKVLRGDLYAMYRAWCCKSENHYTPVGSTTFYSEMTIRGFPSTKAGDWYIYGIKAEQKKAGVIQLV